MYNPTVRIPTIILGESLEVPRRTSVNANIEKSSETRPGVHDRVAVRATEPRPEEYKRNSSVPRAGKGQYSLCRCVVCSLGPRFARRRLNETKTNKSEIIAFALNRECTVHGIAIFPRDITQKEDDVFLLMVS